jgi:hypothetical protein
MLAGRDLTFSGDDVYYYASYVAHGYAPELGHGIEYFLAPHNSHLQLGGKLIYGALFGLFGAEYWVFRAVEVAGILISTGLFYVLARRRVGPIVALAPALLLLFLGYAWEPLLWAFDLHTTYALVFGLAALLALGRGDRRGDVGACVFLVLSASMIELGLAFVVGAAVAIWLAPRPRRRAWIVLVPAALYAIWWVWARRYHQPGVTLTNVHLIPIDFTNALSAVTGSVFGLNPTGVGVIPFTTGVTAAATVAAAAAVIALAVRIRRGAVPRSLWVFLAVLLSYWLTITLGGRPPDSSRYLFAGTVLTLLVAADAASRVAFAWSAIAAIFVLLALAIPANVAKFYDGRRVLLNDAAASGSDYAMLEVARSTVSPDYRPGLDPAVRVRGGGIQAPLPADDYFRAAAEHGRLGYPLSRVRAQAPGFRQAADVALVHAERLRLEEARPPAAAGSCPRAAGASAGAPVHFPLPRDGILLGQGGSQAAVSVEVSRFAKDGPGFEIGRVPPGAWRLLRAPADGAGEPWRVLIDGPLRVCGLGAEDLHGAAPTGGRAKP